MKWGIHVLEFFDELRTLLNYGDLQITFNERNLLYHSHWDHTFCVTNQSIDCLKLITELTHQQMRFFRMAERQFSHNILICSLDLCNQYLNCLRRTKQQNQLFKRIKWRKNIYRYIFGFFYSQSLNIWTTGAKLQDGYGSRKCYAISCRNFDILWKCVQVCARQLTSMKAIKFCNTIWMQCLFDAHSAHWDSEIVFVSSVSKH